MAIDIEDPDCRTPRRKRRRRKLVVNDKVEVRSSEDGFLGSWHPGTVIACENQVRHVKYDHLLCDDGPENLVEFVDVSPAIDGYAAYVTPKYYRGRIRPLPPQIHFCRWSLHYGLCVDVLYMDAWWEGVVFDNEDGTEERTVFFPDMGDEQKFGIDVLRITHDWDEVSENWQPRGNWLFLEIIEQFEEEWPLTISIKQVWYDLREKKDFKKIEEWIVRKEDTWKKLVLEAIRDGIAVTVSEVVPKLDLFKDLEPEEAPQFEFWKSAPADMEGTNGTPPVENNCRPECDKTIGHARDGSFSVGADKLAENGNSAFGVEADSGVQADLEGTSSVVPVEDSGRRECDMTIDHVSEERLPDSPDKLAENVSYPAGLQGNSRVHANLERMTDFLSVGEESLPSDADKLADNGSSPAGVETDSGAQADLVGINAIFPFENNDLLKHDMTIGLVREESLPESADKIAGHGSFASRVEAVSGMDGLISVQQNRACLDFRTKLSILCKRKLYEEHQILSVIPAYLKGILSHSSSNTCGGLSTISLMKSDGMEEFSACPAANMWLPAGFDMLPGAEFCPGAITKYALDTTDKKRSPSSILNVRKHLAYLGWKIEYMNCKHKVKMRYTSPEGKSYYSLRRVCMHFRELAEALSKNSEDEHKNLCALPGNFFSSPVLEESHTVEGKADTPVVSDLVVIEPEYCPEALLKWCVFGEKGRWKLKDRNMPLRAKKHLSAMGWVFWFSIKRGKREMRYKSPTGKVFYNLRAACTNCIEEGHTSSIRGPSNNSDIIDEAGVHFAIGKSSAAIVNTTFNRSLHSNDETELSNVGIQRLKQLGRKRENGIVHRVYPKHEGQMQTEISIREDGSILRLANKRKRRYAKDQWRKRAFMRHGGDAGGSCSTRILRSCKRARDVVVPGMSQSKPRTVLSWLIDNNIILPRTKVYYRNRKDRNPMARGRVTRDGIRCSCCHKVFTLSGFETHAGSNFRRPSANIFLSDGRSLLECKRKMIDKNKSICSMKLPSDGLKGHQHQQNNDYICSVCHYGGELILCDQCPSSFHKSCIGLEDIPEGDWFCPSCCCGICGKNKLNENIEDHSDYGILHCEQCERQYHVVCVQARGLMNLKGYCGGKWFCSKKCEEIFWGLENLLGRPIAVGVNNLTWTLLRSTDHNSGPDPPDTETSTDMYCKLSVALSVMHECFEPVKESRTRRDLIEDVIFSRRSDLNRLNFRGFYTVLLERNDELITVAIVRIHGKKVAEIPLIGTRIQYRRLGMCRILMKELEKKLLELGVERLVLPAVPTVLNTWTASFGFSKMTDWERLKFLDCTFLDFQDTVMCQKLLERKPSLGSSPPKGNMHKPQSAKRRRDDNYDFFSSSPVSEVCQVEKIRESEIIGQELGGSYSDEACFECLDEDGLAEKEGGRNNSDINFKCYKRRRKHLAFANPILLRTE